MHRKINIGVQFRTLDIEGKEIDVSGNCAVQYRTSDGHTFLKTKNSCQPAKPTIAPTVAHPEKVVFLYLTRRSSINLAPVQVLAALVTSQREAKVTLNRDLSVLESVETSEQHEMVTAMRKEAGASVQATQALKITGTCNPVTS